MNSFHGNLLTKNSTENKTNDRVDRQNHSEHNRKLKTLIQNEAEY